MHDAKFPGALDYLRTVRCYVKFERERVELEKQVSKCSMLPFYACMYIHLVSFCTAMLIICEKAPYSLVCRLFLDY